MSPGVRGLARLVGPVGTERESRTLPAHASHRLVPALWLSDSAESREALANELDGPRIHPVLAAHGSAASALRPLGSRTCA